MDPRYFPETLEDIAGGLEAVDGRTVTALGHSQPDGSRAKRDVAVKRCRGRLRTESVHALIVVVNNCVRIEQIVDKRGNIPAVERGPDSSGYERSRRRCVVARLHSAEVGCTTAVLHSRWIFCRRKAIVLGFVLPI